MNMRKFSRGNKTGSSGRFSKRSNRFERRDSGRSSGRMHEVICDKCGQSCEVPFKPTKGKPVYCNDCFRKDERQEPRPNYPKREFRPEHGSSKRDNLEADIQQINAKLDRILEMLNN
jgi:CxxC-x17-CxxC domain-containing protein